MRHPLAPREADIRGGPIGFGGAIRCRLTDDRRYAAHEPKSSALECLPWNGHSQACRPLLFAWFVGRRTMKRDHFGMISWEPPMKNTQLCRDTCLGVMCSALLILSSLCGFAAAAPDTASATNTQDEQNCRALTAFNLQAAAGGPAIIISARLVEVPASGLERFSQSGYAGPVARGPSPIRRYCDVTGYAAPQNKFELKLPLAADWNHKFYFYACGGFCGSIVRDAAKFGLERGYASATGNGGHDSALGFDGVWAANAPELQEDFGWRSNHVVTLITKMITVESQRLRRT